MSIDKSRVKIYVDTGKTFGRFDPFWNFIGYDEINYSTSPGGKETLAKIAGLSTEPYFIRTHHLLCTGNCLGTPKWGSTNVYFEDEKGNVEYDWTEIDEIFDVFVFYGLRPFVEIGFMPEDLAADKGQLSYREGGWACPPKDYQKWYHLIRNLVQHLSDRYGLEEVNEWYWELWNEPDLEYYWKGTLEEFCKLYDFTEAAIRKVLPDAKVGGPATTGPFPGPGKARDWLKGFLEHCLYGKNYFSNETGTRLDFISFHAKGGGYSPARRPKKDTPSSQLFLIQIKEGLDIIKLYPELDDVECILTEADPDGWAAGGIWDNANLNFRNTEYYPSFIAHNFLSISDLKKKYNREIKALTWAFMFDAERCFEGTRTLTTQGIDKPILNLFRMLSFMEGERLSLLSTSARDVLTEGLPERQPLIDGLAVLSANKNQVALLFSSHHDDWDLAHSTTVEIELDKASFDADKLNMVHYRIDKEHSNAYSEWVKQGRPKYPSYSQKQEIKSRENLELFTGETKIKLLDERLCLEFEMPAHSISLIIIGTKEL